MPRAEAQEPAAEQAAEAYASMAVQSRLHDATAEFTLQSGVLPMDAFRKGATFSAAYTQHFGDLLAWEVANGLYSLHFDTDLRGDLENLSIAPTPFEVLDWMVTSNLVLKPIYWKGAVANQRLVHGEILFVAGGGLGSFTRSQRVVVDVGSAIRLYLARRWSIRVDVRHHMFLEDSILSSLSLHHELWAGLGVSFSL